jgi:uncharacterized protein (TIGR03437 family)
LNGLPGVIGIDPPYQPTALELRNGTVVTAGDLELAVPLYYVSPNQINAQIPFEVLGTNLRLYVTTTEGKSQPYILSAASFGPGLFTLSGDGKGTTLAFDSNFHALDAAEAGKPMILYATGLGPTDPPALSGAPGAAVEPLNRVVTVPDVFIGEAPARVDYAGLAPGLAGVYQLNVVPQQLSTDRVSIRVQGYRSNVASVKTLPGPKNVANAIGTIQAIYPPTDPNAPPIAYSPLLLAAKFAARMDILPTAGPFIVAAVSDAASSIISVDPATGTFDGNVIVPTQASRVGDFSAAEFRAIDFLSCVASTCLPFPNNIVPASRISPLELMALSQIPLPNTPVPNSSTGLIKVRGTIQKGTTFVIDPQNNTSLSVFAGYLPIAAPPKSGTTTLKLYIDGVAVASLDIAYRSPFP